MTQKQKKQAERRAWISFRYLFPVGAILATLGSFWIPCMRFVTPDTGTNEAISLARLIANAWGQVRVYLFATAKQDAANVAFSWTVLITLILLVLLFAVGLAVAIWTAAAALRYFDDPEDRSRGRLVFLTLFPNRIVTCVWEALVLPLLFFPRLMVLFYENILNYSVILKLTFAEPWMIGCVLLAAAMVLTAAFQPIEVAAGMNPYKKKRKTEPQKAEEPVKADAPVFATKEEQEHYEMVQRTKEEQAERIRKLLYGDDENTTNGNEHGT